MKTRRTYTLYTVGLVVAGLVSGCASTGALHSITPLSTRLGSYKMVVVQVTSAIPDSTQEVVLLETMTIARLRDKHLLEKVVSEISAGDMQGDLRLILKIVVLNRVDAGSRVLFGAFAGQASVVVDAELVDLKEMKSLGAFTAEGKSSGGTVFAGTTPQAVERAVEQVVGFVETNHQWFSLNESTVLERSALEGRRACLQRLWRGG